ncbi:CoA transferase [uncultured Phenylobacterium sp.]|uniref:CaiB/BaiF CoA transferase family protein n=1 Tax=uncultured Phenylobacterium sp. TaxID=349273 RepID=UPI0025CD1D0A|nr:CoA transferase [uncultured Phenylobacterium sp.]
MTAHSDDAALAGLMVIDASDSVAGQHCGRLLADYGAEVVLLEPPDGSPTRRLPPFTMKRSAPENSLLFWTLNTGKRSLRTPGDVKLASLCQGADVILVDAARRDELGFVEAQGQAVICAFSAFGDTGPYLGWTGGELIQQALSGVMFPTGAPGHKPIYGLGRRSEYACGVTAYSAILAALHVRERTGRGQDVEAVISDAAAAMGQALVSNYSYDQTFSGRQAYKGTGMLALLKCADGWMVIWVRRTGWRETCEIFGVPHLANDPRFSTIPSLAANWNAAVDILRRHSGDKRTEETCQRLQAAKVCAALVATPSQLLQLEQFAGRGMWRYIDDAGTRMLSIGPAFRTSTPCRPIAPAPLLGPKMTRDAGPPPRSASRAWRREPAELPELPLAGVRILDFTQAWAGPMATRALGYLGAHVIKIENAEVIDSWRGGLRPPADGWEDRFYDKMSLFNSQNHDKQSISLDLKSPAGRDIALRLAAVSDVAVANFSSGVLDKLGLGFKDMSKVNPAISVCEMPAFGNSGPWKSHIAMGKTMEAAAGMASLMGYGDGVPLLTGPAHLDPVGGLHGTAAIMTALLHQKRTGQGQYVEIAQVEAAMHWVGEYLVQAALGETPSPPDGNRNPDAAPHDAYPCAGEDEWVAIAVYTDEEWLRLRALVGDPRLDVPALATVGGRREDVEAIDAAIAAWTRGQDKRDVAALLQAHGVPAAPVTTGGDVYRDPHLRSRGMIAELDHPDRGRKEYSSLAFRLSATPGAMRTAAPRFAEHTDVVLRGLLGLSEAEVEQLVADGVVRRAPIPFRL